MKCPLCDNNIKEVDVEDAIEYICNSCGYIQTDFNCVCGSGETDTWPEYDAQGIYLCKVCKVCKDEKLSKYRPEILSGYTQANVDEPIEPEGT